MTDTKVVLAVVLLLGTFALGGLAGAIWLISTGSPAESIAIISGLSGTALGSLGTLLASTRSSATPTEVTVANTAADPVPVNSTPGPPPLPPILGGRD